MIQGNSLLRTDVAEQRGLLSVWSSHTRHSHPFLIDCQVSATDFFSSLLGGDCLDDFARLREETGLRQMLGHELPSPEAARKFLYQFHDQTLIEEAQQELTAGQVAYIPDENAALQGLGRVNDDLL